MYIRSIWLYILMSIISIYCVQPAYSYVDEEGISLSELKVIPFSSFPREIISHISSISEELDGGYSDFREYLEDFGEPQGYIVDLDGDSNPELIVEFIGAEVEQYLIYALVEDKWYVLCNLFWKFGDMRIGSTSTNGIFDIYYEQGYLDDTNIVDSFILKWTEKGYVTYKISDEGVSSSRTENAFFIDDDDNYVEFDNIPYDVIREAAKGCSDPDWCERKMADMQRPGWTVDLNGDGIKDWIILEEFKHGYGFYGFYLTTEDMEYKGCGGFEETDYYGQLHQVGPSETNGYLDMYTNQSRTIHWQDGKYVVSD